MTELMIEESILRAAMLGGTPWEHGVEWFHFSEKRNRKVWYACRAVAERKEAVNVVSVAQELDSGNRLEDVGGHAFLMNLGDEIPENAVFSCHQNCQYLKKNWHERKAREAIDSVSLDDLGPEAVKEKLTEIRDHLDFSNDRVVEKWVSGKSVAAEFQEWKNRTAEAGLTELGFPTLDRMIGGGVGPGMYGVIGGRAGSGKSTIGTTIMKKNCFKKKIIYLSLEMSRFRIMENMIAGNPDLLERYKGDGFGVTFLEDGRDVDDLEKIVRDINRKEKHDMMIIDHFHLLRGRGKDSYHQRTHISKVLQTICYDNEMALIALAQLNRSNAKENRKPAISDLRDSGSIEEEADFVMLFNRGRTLEDGTVEQSELNLVKNRKMGQLGRVKVLYRGETRDMAEIDDKEKSADDFMYQGF